MAINIVPGKTHMVRLKMKDNIATARTSRTKNRRKLEENIKSPVSNVAGTISEKIVVTEITKKKK